MVTHQIMRQVNQCIDLLTHVLGNDLLGIYLYGSSVVGGLQKYSDIDLLVVLERATTQNEKNELIKNLLQISGVYMKSAERPIELTMVVKSAINPWHYPPQFDFQYGEWLRKEFETGIVEPWPTKVMPDLALLITHVLLANKTLFGPNPNQLLCVVPFRDVVLATADALKNLNTDLHNDTRNVLLTYARIWRRLEDNVESSKPAAALWAMNRLPEEYKSVLERARSICMGKINENWQGIESLIEPCADFMANEIHERILLIEKSDYDKKSIYLDKNNEM